MCLPGAFCWPLSLAAAASRGRPLSAATGRRRGPLPVSDYGRQQADGGAFSASVVRADAGHHRSVAPRLRPGQRRRVFFPISDRSENRLLPRSRRQALDRRLCRRRGPGNAPGRGTFVGRLRGNLSSGRIRALFPRNGSLGFIQSSLGTRPRRIRVPYRLGYCGVALYESLLPLDRAPGLYPEAGYEGIYQISLLGRRHDQGPARARLETEIPLGEGLRRDGGMVPGEGHPLMAAAGAPGRVLVTGGTGFLGRHLLDLLADGTRKVAVLVRKGDRSEGACGTAGRSCRGRLRRPGLRCRGLFGRQARLSSGSRGRRAG